MFEDEPFNEFDPDVKSVIHSVPSLQTGDYIRGEVLMNWNTIPYGLPGKCQDNLVTVLDRQNDPNDILKKTLHHLMELCPKTKRLLLYVDIGSAKWKEVWFPIEHYFDKLEDTGLEILVYFRQ